MNRFLAELSQAVSPGAHAVVLMDKSGWHTAGDLAVPENLSLVFLLTRSLIRDNNSRFLVADWARLGTWLKAIRPPQKMTQRQRCDVSSKAMKLLIEKSGTAGLTALRSSLHKSR